MAVIDMYDKITQALDENKYAVGIFIDLYKAFDTVNHSILFKKIRIIWNKRVLSELVWQLSKKSVSVCLY